MCGIAGAFSRMDSTSVVARMSARLVHRGPDDSGELTLRGLDGRCAGAFALRRLAIQDLSPAGHQPMVSADGRYAITFNGEIYNFHDLRRELIREGAVFQSHADTEVVLIGVARHGPAFIRRLRGMF